MKDSELSSRLGFAFKEDINRAIEDGNVFQGGLEWVTKSRYSFSNKIRYEGKLRVYKFLYNSESDKLPNENWKAPDADLENTLSIGLSKYFQLTLYLEAIYEKEQSRRIQIRENLAFGLTYKLF